VELRADFLIIGSGIAALRAAAELAGAGDVLILTKAEPREGNTGYAQGGIAAAVGPGDTPELHGADTTAAGDGLCDEAAVRVLVEDGPRYVRELIAWGARFDRDADGEPALAIEGAHSARRVLHAHDATGREIGRVLWERASALPGVATHDHSRVVELLVEPDGGRCGGARFLSENGALATARANTVLLATGGAGQVYSETTNPHVATGDGVAMAYRAGAAVADLEFVQFHPTALSVPGQPRFLLSEALRGEGARLLNADGEPFMKRYHPAGDLAPRDRVSRAIVREASRTARPVFLSLEHLDADYVHERFPLISDACRLAGLDLARDPIPVGPAAHYVMGGVSTDLDGRTTIPGLYAAGEVACTGVHGANRLASNSLLEGLVFGARAGRSMRQEFRAGAAPRFSPAAGTPEARRAVDSSTSGAHGAGDEPGGVDALRYPDLMWRDVGLFRDRAGLARALDVLEPAWRALDARLRGGPPLDAAEWRTASILAVGRLIARAALRREESRGGHYRSDFPDRDDVHWKRRVTECQ
jgi:L-aspartate oxidase